ncbi:MAG: response regulator [Deltaproteobacteria bacterium]|nr:response regulator [Deltaproteobacteria bacterium]
MSNDDENDELRSTAMQNAQAILAAGQRAELELRETKEALEDEMRVLATLNRTCALLSSTLDLKSLVQEVTDAGTQLSGAQFGAFFHAAIQDAGGVFTLYTLSGAPREAFEKFGHPRATALFAPTFRGEGVIRIGNVLKDPRYGKSAPHHGMPAQHLPVCSYLAVPVISRTGEILGGLFFGHSAENVFTERTERVIAGLAAQAAIALDNARLFDEVKRAAEVERATRAEIERISVMKDEFLATLSHELRTPLNAVLGWSELLLSADAAHVDTRRGLETIARNARAQAQMIEDLLDMNRIVSGKVRIDVQQIELDGVINAALDSIKPSADARELQVRVTLDPNAGPVFGDPHRVQQIVWNLLSNAVKFTPKGGRIDVLLRRASSHVEITVSDSGAGIAPAFLPHVFERFRQADSSSTRRYGGLGLGLSIVKQLVELHGGSVRVESPGEGLGATFTVSLPICASQDEGPPRAVRMAPHVEHAVSLDGVRVLVVDDEQDARELLRGVLESAGATVTTASGAEEAVATIRRERPDVLVSDIGMPGRDGYHLLRVIRTLPADQGGRTPAIAVTAFARVEDRTRALLAGYQVHIAKPIAPHELIVTVASAAGRTGA